MAVRKSSRKRPASATSNQEAGSTQVETRTNTEFSDKDFDHFKQIILSRRLEAVEDIDRMRIQLDDVREQAENDTAYSFHMADAGTDAMEREKLYLMMARQKKYVGYLDRALERIRNRTLRDMQGDRQSHLQGTPGGRTAHGDVDRGQGKAKEVGLIPGSGPDIRL